MQTNRSRSVTRVSFVAGDSLFAAGIAHSEMTGVAKVNHSFEGLFTRLQTVRETWGWQTAGQLVFVAAVDLNSDRQGGLLQKAEEAGAIIDPVDYRDYYPGPYPGGSTVFVPSIGERSHRSIDHTDDTESDPQSRFRPTLSPRLNFLLGGLAARLGPLNNSSEVSRAEVLVCAHHYEIKDALMELKDRGADVGIAFYRSMMEPRWERFGLFGSNCPIRFYDLAPHLDDITTLGQRRRLGTRPRPPSAASSLF